MVHECEEAHTTEDADPRGGKSQTDASRGEIERARTTERTRADNRHRRFLQLAHARPANLFQQNMALVAFEMFGGQTHALSLSPPGNCGEPECKLTDFDTSLSYFIKCLP